MTFMLQTIELILVKIGELYRMQVEQHKIQKKKSIIKIFEGNVEKLPAFVEQKV